MKREIRVISNNPDKIKEIQQILDKQDINVVACAYKVEELQTSDVIHLVKDKALKAFKRNGRPLIVEHTGLYLENIDGLPGGLTQIFWDTLQANRFASIFGTEGKGSKAEAKTIVCYVDGKNFHTFEGSIKGSIIHEPKGDSTFQWDCVFVPEGYSQTFAEMGMEKKNEISMRQQALLQFAAYFKEEKIR